MTLFTSQWLENPQKTPDYSGSKRSETLSTLQRLVGGSRWLSNQHKLYFTDDPAAVGNETFYRALSGWEKMEAHLRDQDDHEGCIFGPGQQCPREAVVNCAACV